MANKKEYVIEINGIKESIDAVKTLNQQLDTLEARIKSLEGKAVKVGASSSGGGGGGGNASALSAEEKLEKEILATEEKIAKVRSESYQKLLAAKEELKEATQIAKSQAAATENKQGLYDTNTMQGMKAQLSSIKQEMQTVDVNSDKFKQLTQQANELNNKLLELEKGFGQFGHNVGRYSEGVAEGMQKVVIKVGDTERTFESAKQASRELGNELKNMAVNGQQGTKEYNDLDVAVKKLNSDLKDVSVSSKGMDTLLDTMQSLVAVASAAKGISSLFGMDNSAIEESIRQLMALQNVMKSLEVIQQQMKTGEGIGGWLAKGNGMIDEFVNKLFKAKTAQVELNAAEKSGEVTAKGMTVAMESQAVATTTATRAAQALSVALKTIGIGAIVALIGELVNMYDEWIDKQKKAEDEAEELRRRVEEQRQTFTNAAATYAETASRISNMRTQYLSTNDELKKTAILKSATEEFKKMGIAVRTVTDAQRILVQQGGQVIELLTLQGEAAALSAIRMEKFKELFQNKINNGYDVKGATILTSSNQFLQELDSEIASINQKASTIQSKLKIGVGNVGRTTRNAVRDNGRSMVDTIKQVENNITSMKLKLMQDGLHKELMQLDENNRKEIEKIRQSGKKVEEQLALQSQVYQKQRQKLLDDYSKHTVELANKNILGEIQNQADNIQNTIDELQRLYVVLNQPTSLNENIGLTPSTLLGMKEGEIMFPEASVKKIFDLYALRNDSMAKNSMKEYFKALKEEFLPMIELENSEMYEKIIDEKGLDKANEYLERIFKEKTAYIFEFLTKYTDNVSILNGKFEQTLTQSLEGQISLIDSRTRTLYDTISDNIKKRNEKLQEGLLAQQKIEVDAVQKTILEVTKAFSEAKKQYNILPEMSDEDAVEHFFDMFKKGMEIDNTQISKNEEELMNYARRINALYEQLTIIYNNYSNQITKSQQDTAEEIKSNNAKFYDDELTAMDRYIAKANELMQKQPELGKLNLIDIDETRKNYQDVIQMYEYMLENIKALKIDATNASIKREILGEDVQRINDSIEVIKQTINGNLQDVRNKNKELLLDFAKQINEWVQQLGNAIDSILGSFAEIQSNRYEKEIDQQEKYIDKYNELLDKQRDITQEYADKINSIEDELAQSRGDRRQYLVDQLNAEIAARRASAAEEKKIEKQQEAAEKKKKKLEQQQAKNQKDMALWQARVNAAMAISNAAVNKYPVPAIPMIALATAIGAAQIAAVRSQNIPQYAEGGVLVGKSHKKGGLPVLGGKAEVEGGEFITNKVTTTKNVELLEYINSKKKKIDITDLLEFYSSPRVRKNITAVRTKFANGGILPSYTTELGLNDRLMQSFEDYSNRPVVVEVKEILSKADSVRNVQVLAGLSPETI